MGKKADNLRAVIRCAVGHLDLAEVKVNDLLDPVKLRKQAANDFEAIRTELAFIRDDLEGS